MELEQAKIQGASQVSVGQVWKCIKSLESYKTRFREIGKLFMVACYISIP